MYKSVTLVTPVTLIYKAILSKTLEYCYKFCGLGNCHIFYATYDYYDCKRYIYIYCPTSRTLAPETMNFPNLCRPLPI